MVGSDMLRGRSLLLKGRYRMIEDDLLVGVCCQYCTKFEGECPIKNASPWSRWKNFCSEYDPNKDKYPEALTIKEAVLKA